MLSKEATMRFNHVNRGYHYMYYSTTNCVCYYRGGFLISTWIVPGTLDADA